MADDLTRSVVAALGYAADEVALSPLREALEAGLLDARAAYPALAITEEALGRFLADRLTVEGDLAAAVAALRFRDLYLACACAAGDGHAARAFERAVMPAVRKALARVDPDPVFMDEISETVRVKLLVGAPNELPKIASYLGGGPLTSYAQVVALREAQSEKRRKRPETPIPQDELLDVRFAGGGPELARLEREVRGPFRAAFADALMELSPRDRNVLRLYLVDDVASETIARMYKVHRGTVARWVTAARERVLSGTRKRLMKELRLGDASVDSLVGQLAEDLDITLSTFLNEPA